MPRGNERGAGRAADGAGLPRPGGHILTYRNYGRDPLDLLVASGFAVTHLMFNIPSQGATPESGILCRQGRHADVTVRCAPSGRRALQPLAPFRLFLLLRYSLAGFLHNRKEARRS